MLCLTHFLSSGGCAFVLIVAPAHWMYPQSQGGRFRGGFNWNSSVSATFPSAHVHRLPWSSFFPLVHLNGLPGPAKQICHNTVIWSERVLPSFPLTKTCRQLSLEASVTRRRRKKTKLGEGRNLGRLSLERNMFLAQVSESFLLISSSWCYLNTVFIFWFCVDCMEVIDILVLIKAHC